MTPSAPKMALQVAWETSVLPATTAAPGCGGQEGPGRDDQCQRLQAAIVERDIVADQTAKDIKQAGAGDGRGGVEVALVLFAGAGKVDYRAAGLLVDANGTQRSRPLSIL